ncbi:hypothetical protein AHF37_12267 [Paragonimus kellicotti]|nr:hypothetical protein AHF37_12267 [Paragonimus kellicotti]
MRKMIGKCNSKLKAILSDVAILLDHCYLDGCNWDLQIFQDLLKTVNEEHIRRVVVFANTLLRFKSCIDAASDLFCKKTGANIPCFSKSCFTHEAVIYSLLFTLDETGIEGLPIALSLLNSELAKSLLHFFSSADVIEDLKSCWSGIYEEEFVTNDLLDTFKRWQNAIVDYYSVFAEHLKGCSHQPRKPMTEVQPFNLTPAKPRAIPIPEPIPQLAKYRTVPDSTYTLPEEFQKIEQLRKANFAEVSTLMFALQHSFYNTFDLCDHSVVWSEDCCNFKTLEFSFQASYG